MRIFKIILPIIFLIAGLFLSLFYFTLLVVLYIVFIYFTERTILFRLKSKHFLSFLGILIFVYPLFGEKKDFMLPLNVGYDFNYMEMSLRMSLRAILLFGFSNVIFLNISPKKILYSVEVQNYQQFVDIAMNSYSIISKKTLKHFRDYRFSKFKISSFMDFLGNFMAELLTIENYVPTQKKREVI